MCGICGVYDPEGVDRQLLLRMRDEMLSRGRDDSGVFVGDGGRLGLGHRRLSILDLSPAGRQPLHNEDDGLQIVVNGEFYGFRSVARSLESRGHTLRSASDSEIALHLYEEQGERFLGDLNGMFAIGLWDSEHRRLVVARDRAGKKPLYIAHKGMRFAFASTIDALLELPWVGRDLDPVALDEFFALGYVPGESCIFSDIRKLPPASLGVFDAHTGSFDIRSYWSLPEPGSFHGTQGDLVDRLEETLSLAVSERLVADVGVGVFLSGGVDSSIVAALAARTVSRGLRTFTIGFGEKSHDERPFARIVADHIGSDHTELLVTEDFLSVVDDLPAQYGEPFADSSAIPTYLISRLTREHVTVALSGDGGDELFGGYNWYSWVARGTALRRRLGPLAPLVGASAALLPRGTRGKHYLERLALNSAEQFIDRTFLYSSDLRATLLSGKSGEMAAGRHPEAWVKAAASADGDLLTWMTRADFRRYLVDDVLVKVDRASMAVPLEVRSPLLDRRVIELAFSLPASLRFEPGRPKAVLKGLAGRLLPETLNLERKQGFSVPLAQWMNSSLGDRTVEALRDVSEAGRWVNPAMADTLLREHRDGRQDNSQRLWALLMFALWAERYL